MCQSDSRQIKNFKSVSDLFFHESYQLELNSKSDHQIKTRINHSCKQNSAEEIWYEIVDTKNYGFNLWQINPFVNRYLWINQEMSWANLINFLHYVHIWFLFLFFSFFLFFLRYIIMLSRATNVTFISEWIYMTSAWGKNFEIIPLYIS